MSSNFKLATNGISMQSLTRMDRKNPHELTEQFTSSNESQGCTSSYLTMLNKSDIATLGDTFSQESEDMEDELEDDNDIVPKEQEESEKEISDLDTDSDIEDLPCPWHVIGSPEYKKQYASTIIIHKRDWFALPIDCNSFPEVIFPKAPTLGTRVVNAFRWTKDRGMYTDFVKVKHIDSPWNHIAHYVDWEAYGYDLKLIGTITLPMGSHDACFSVFWRPSHTWYDAIFEANINSDPQEVVVMRHNLALPSLYAWMEHYHKQSLNIWMSENREKFWYM
ncbi:hypothetical protein M422DRAFT_248311 [Sphaerobolus stellatus SS14]|uniref:Uncharacterized protein n=1 Tax=Sphaerobolus stellatus (strain SS14) TaxID=990650 RepID=A0A0C9VWJ2_SPHS4|nr:hypothetical protein M422DRAFT_248311 [Sphaerobolus stellatus SS14]